MSTQLDNSFALADFEKDCFGAVALDRSLTIRAVSDGVIAHSGFSRDYLLGRSALEVVHPDDLERASEAIVEAQATAGMSEEGMYRLRFADGSYHRLALRATTIECAGEREMVFQFSAVSARLRAEEFASDTVNTLRMLAETHGLDDCLERVHRLAERHLTNVDLLVTTVDADHLHHHIRLSREDFACRILEGSDLPEHVRLAQAQDLLGPWRTFKHMARLDIDLGRARVTAVMTDEAGVLLGYFVALSDGVDEPTYSEWMVYGLIRQVLTVVLRRVRVDAQLRRAADSDPLTGLVNRRRLFRDMAHAELEDSALLLIDLDRFSWFNNTLGHQVGDQALIALANQLVDLAPPGATVARIGGDEFVVWLPDGIAAARDVAEKMHVTPIHPAGVEDRRATVRSSIGGVTIRAGESAADAIGRADAAMYLVKDLGGDDSHFA